MKEFKAQRCASGPNVLFFLLLIASNRREGWRSIRRDRRLPARATARTAPEPVIHITGGLLRVPFADPRHRFPRQTGSTPRVSSSESRRFSRDTKTSSSVSTSSCRRCVRQISRVSRRRAMRTARRGILRRSHAAYPRGVRVFASSRIAAVAPARAIPRRNSSAHIVGAIRRRNPSAQFVAVARARNSLTAAAARRRAGDGVVEGVAGGARDQLPLHSDAAARAVHQLDPDRVQLLPLAHLE